MVNIKKSLKITVWLLAMLSTANAWSDGRRPNSVLMVDRSVVNAKDMAFPNEDRIYPKVGDFEVLSYVSMSSRKGERWAAVTLRNTADGNRQVDHDHLMGLFADGDRQTPAPFKKMLSSKQIITVTMNFGESLFPLLEVYSRSSKD